MFDKDFRVYGLHANYLKDLCDLAGNVPDKDAHNNFKIFPTYVDAYLLCPLIGYQYSRKAEMGTQSEGSVGIFADALIRRQQQLKYIYQVLMLVDEDSEPDVDRRIYRAFNFSEKTQEDRDMIATNMKIYNNYFLGGIEVLHEQFADQCTDEDSYLMRMYNYVEQFEQEQNPEALKEGIDKLLNK
jgi:hypothetical protein